VLNQSSSLILKTNVANHVNQDAKVWKPQHKQQIVTIYILGNYDPGNFQIISTNGIDGWKLYPVIFVLLRLEFDTC
jgi:hypothetical protein